MGAGPVPVPVAPVALSPWRGLAFGIAACFRRDLRCERREFAQSGASRSRSACAYKISSRASIRAYIYTASRVRFPVNERAYGAASPGRWWIFICRTVGREGGRKEGGRKEEGGRRKEEGGRRKEEGGRARGREGGRKEKKKREREREKVEGVGEGWGRERARERRRRKGKKSEGEEREREREIERGGGRGRGEGGRREKKGRPGYRGQRGNTKLILMAVPLFLPTGGTARGPPSKY